MTEFLDFLKYKFAYVAKAEFKPGKFQEAEQLFEKAVSTYKHGFKGAYLLQEPGTDRGMALVLWESQEEMEANQTEVSSAIVEQMKPLFATAPTVTFYEVCSEIHSQDE